MTNNEHNHWVHEASVWLFELGLDPLVVGRVRSLIILKKSHIDLLHANSETARTGLIAGLNDHFSNAPGHFMWVAQTDNQLQLDIL